MGSPSAVLAVGFGSWGSPSEVITLGYGSSGVVIVAGPFRAVAAQSFQARAVSSKVVQSFQPGAPPNTVQRFQPGAQSVQGIQ